MISRRTTLVLETLLSAGLALLLLIAFVVAMPNEARAQSGGGGCGGSCIFSNGKCRNVDCEDNAACACDGATRTTCDCV